MKTYIMHENSMDVCIKIDGAYYTSEGDARVIGEWYNLGYTGNPWPCEISKRLIKINKQDINKWKKIDPFVKRTKSGRPD